jgi:hypothetical protein
MRRTVIQAMALAVAASACSVGHAVVVNAAYNDFFDSTAGAMGGNAAHVTNYTTGANTLIDQTSANPFGTVTVAFPSGTTTGTSIGGLSGTPTGDAATYFSNPAVNMVGYQNVQSTLGAIVAGAAPGVLVFTGLNPGDQYDLVIATYRGQASCGATLENIQSFTNATTATATTSIGATNTIFGNFSAGAYTLVTDSTQYVNANSAIVYDDGVVALHFTNIVPNIDPGSGLGTFSVDLLTGGSALGKMGPNVDYNGRWGAFRLEEVSSVPEPTSLSLLGLGGLALLRRRR